MGKDLTRRVRENNGEVAERGPVTLQQQIRSMENEFALAMPRGMEATQLIRDALTCLRQTPKLAECTPATVLGGLMTCAQLGLRPGVLGHAWLLPFWDSRDRCHKAQLVIGYQGYRELAHRSGLIATVIGRAVHEYDQFDIDYGLADNLIHKPKLDGDRGEATGYYSIVKYAGGGYAFWHMSRREVELHRDRYAMARNKQGVIVGPWRDNFDEMAVKTTFRKLAKWMPKSTELAAAVEADETVRVDLSPEGILHGQRPDVVDGELAGELEAGPGEGGAESEAEAAETGHSEAEGPPPEVEDPPADLEQLANSENTGGAR